MYHRSGEKPLDPTTLASAYFPVTQLGASHRPQALAKPPDPKGSAASWALARCSPQVGSVSHGHQQGVLGGEPPQNHGSSRAEKISHSLDGAPCAVAVALQDLKGQQCLPKLLEK